MRRIALLGMVAGLLVPTAAQAANTAPMPFTTLTPDDGLSRVQNTDCGGYSTTANPKQEFFMDSTFPSGRVPEIEISTQNVPGQDGTLADDFVVGFHSG